MDGCDASALVSMYVYDEAAKEPGVPAGKGSLSAASMLDVVGVWDGLSRLWEKDSCPAMGESVKKRLLDNGLNGGLDGIGG